jgi:hypothetical protein
MKEISRNYCDFFKHKISIRGSHCDHSTWVPKNLAMPLALGSPTDAQTCYCFKLYTIQKRVKLISGDIEVQFSYKEGLRLSTINGRVMYYSAKYMY